MADINVTLHEALLTGAEALRAIADADDNDEPVGYIFDRLDLNSEALRALASALDYATCPVDCLPEMDELLIRTYRVFANLVNGSPPYTQEEIQRMLNEDENDLLGRIFEVLAQRGINPDAVQDFDNEEEEDDD